MNEPRRRSVAATLDLLADRSLLVAEERGGRTRYRMLEPVRLFAANELTPTDQRSIERAHAAYFADLAVRADRAMTGPDQVTWLSIMRAEQDNLRAVFDRGMAADELALVSTMGNYWLTSGRMTEGRSRLEHALASDEADDAARARALRWAGQLARVQGDFEVARARVEEALDLARSLGSAPEVEKGLQVLAELELSLGDAQAAEAIYEDLLADALERDDARGAASARYALGNIARHAGDLAAAEAHYGSALEVFRARGDLGSIGSVLSGLGSLAIKHGDLDEAKTRYTDALAINRQIGDLRGMAFVLNNLASATARSGDLAAARRHYEEALGLLIEIGDRAGAASILNNLGNLAVAQADHPAALESFRRGLSIAREIGSFDVAEVIVEGTAYLCSEMGDAWRATVLLGGADAIVQKAGLTRARSTRRATLEASVRDVLGDEEFERAVDEGRTSSVEDIFSMVSSL